MKNPDLLLGDILRLKNDFIAEGIKLPPGLAGMYGELLAFKKMREIFLSSGAEVKYFSGQKGADTQVSKNGKKIAVEIKTSRLKDEGYGYWYGAALNVKKCRNGHSDATFNHRKRGVIQGDFCYFDFVIFVALDDDFEEKFYIIPRSFIEQNKELFINNHKRFISPSHRILVSDGKGMPTLEERYHPIIKATEAYKDRWDLIGHELEIAS